MVLSVSVYQTRSQPFGWLELMVEDTFSSGRNEPGTTRSRLLKLYENALCMCVCVCISMLACKFQNMNRNTIKEQTDNSHKDGKLLVLLLLSCKRSLQFHAFNCNIVNFLVASAPRSCWNSKQTSGTVTKAMMTKCEYTNKIT